MNKKRSKLLILSIALNVIIVTMLMYASCLKTDLGKRCLIKLGIIEKKAVPFSWHPEFPEIEGWANSLTKMKIKADAVFYGNSITFQSNFQDFFPQARICNLGCNFDDLEDLINRSFIIKSVQPDMIFILGGINKFYEISLDDFQQKYGILVDTIIRQNPQARIFLQSMLPINPSLRYGKRYSQCKSKIKDANLIIKKISATKGCTFVDLYPLYSENDSLPSKYTEDGLHLRQEAYKLWSHEISPFFDNLKKVH